MHSNIHHKCDFSKGKLYIYTHFLYTKKQEKNLKAKKCLMDIYQILHVRHMLALISSKPLCSYQRQVQGVERRGIYFLTPSGTSVIRLVSRFIMSIYFQTALRNHTMVKNSRTLIDQYYWVHARDLPIAAVTIMWQQCNA